MFYILIAIRSEHQAIGEERQTTVMSDDNDQNILRLFFIQSDSEIEKKCLLADKKESINKLPTNKKALSVRGVIFFEMSSYN